MLTDSEGGHSATTARLVTLYKYSTISQRTAMLGHETLPAPPPSQWMLQREVSTECFDINNKETEGRNLDHLEFEWLARLLLV